jgi:hypothetical protein
VWLEKEPIQYEWSNKIHWQISWIGQTITVCKMKTGICFSDQMSISGLCTEGKQLDESDGINKHRILLRRIENLLVSMASNSRSPNHSPLNYNVCKNKLFVKKNLIFIGKL